MTDNVVRLRPQSCAPLFAVQVSLNGDAAEAAKFYQAVFNAVEIKRSQIRRRDGSGIRVELLIGGLCLEIEGGSKWPQSPKRGLERLRLLVTVSDSDEIWKRAVSAGCKVEEPYQATLWEASGRLRDPFGIEWIVRQA